MAKKKSKKDVMAPSGSKRGAALQSGNVSQAYAPKRGTDGFRDVPHSIYFYYVGPEYIDGSGDPYRKVFHYYYFDPDRPIYHDEVEDRVTALAENARRHPSRQYPPAHGEDFKYVVWDCKSYIVFLVDDDIELERDGAVDFQPTIWGGGDNHSFFDAWDMSIEVAGNLRPAVGCVNYMKRDLSGADLGRIKQVFTVTVNPKTGSKRLTWPDSGGTNNGPPIGPP